jgi:hypothetical protein
MARVSPGSDALEQCRLDHGTQAVARLRRDDDHRLIGAADFFPILDLSGKDIRELDIRQ